MILAMDIPAMKKSLKVSRTTLTRWMARPEGPAKLHRLLGCGRVLVSVEELQRFLRHNTDGGGFTGGAAA